MIGGGNGIPTEMSTAPLLEVAAEPYRRNAPNGIKNPADGFDGAGAIRVARDALVAARPLLAPHLPLGFGEGQKIQDSIAYARHALKGHPGPGLCLGHHHEHPLSSSRRVLSSLEGSVPSAQGDTGPAASAGHVQRLNSQLLQTTKDISR